MFLELHCFLSPTPCALATLAFFTFPQYAMPLPASPTPLCPKHSSPSPPPIFVFVFLFFRSQFKYYFLRTINWLYRIENKEYTYYLYIVHYISFVSAKYYNKLLYAYVSHFFVFLFRIGCWTFTSTPQRNSSGHKANWLYWFLSLSCFGSLFLYWVFWDHLQNTPL